MELTETLHKMSCKEFESKAHVPRQVTDDQRYYCIAVAWTSLGKAKTNGMRPGPEHTNDLIHEQGGKRKTDNHGQNQIME